MFSFQTIFEQTYGHLIKAMPWFKMNEIVKINDTLFKFIQIQFSCPNGNFDNFRQMEMLNEINIPHVDSQNFWNAKSKKN